MSKEFIQAKVNANYISNAVRQEEQLSYFLESDLQESFITHEYIQQWASRKYQSNDYFLNFIKSVFKDDVFLKFYKYLRRPIPSTKLIKNRIEPQLKRMFVSENADFRYSVKGVDQSKIKEDLNIKIFEQDLFYHILFKHNSIIIASVSDEKATRFFLDIKNVISIEESNNSINRIAFNAVANIGGEIKKGIAYYDKQQFAFYDYKYELIGEPLINDLGYVPAHFIVNKKFNREPIIKESLFSYMREELEEYVFLKTLQKMTEPSGAIPVTTTIEIEKESEDIDGTFEPVIDEVMSSQKAKEYSTNPPKSTGLLQPGMVHEIPLGAIQDNEGRLDTDLLNNFISFKFIPVDILTYINERIQQIEDSIITTTVGDILGRREEAQNELQVEKSLTTLQNNLLNIVEMMNRSRKLSDQDILKLNYGVNAVDEVFIFYGTDFLLDSVTKLYDDLEKAPNPIERKNILVRINQNKYKSNQEQLIRQNILYELLPYVSDKDFDIARNSNQVDNTTMQYQLRFTYWVQMFESKYGDIVNFYNSMEIEPIQKFILINNLIKQLINENNLRPDKTGSQS